MSQITALMIDSREPAWVQALKFGGVPTVTTLLDTGDVQAVTDDNHTLIIERKTPDDFLNTLKDDRLFPQLARMTEIRNAQQNNGQAVTYWPYLIITDVFTSDRNGKVVTDRGVTGWSFSSVMGSLVSIQEMGVYVVFANGQNDYQDCILRLGRRNRDQVMTILPPRVPNILGPKATFLASLPGVGIERVQEILDWSGHNVGHALVGITDTQIKSPVGIALRRNIRAMFGLEENENLEIVDRTQIEISMKEFVKGE